MKYFLRIGNDYLEEAKPHATLAKAKAAYREVAQELDRYGQAIAATVHIAKTLDDVAEYPDFVLTYEDARVITENA